MNLSKKISAVLLALVLSMAFMVQSFALPLRPVSSDDPTSYPEEMMWKDMASTASVTISGTSADHTYTAFQIFSGVMAQRQKLFDPDSTVTDGSKGYPAYTATLVTKVYPKPAGYTAGATLDDGTLHPSVTYTEMQLYKKTTTAYDNDKITNSTAYVTDSEHTYGVGGFTDTTVWYLQSDSTKTLWDVVNAEVVTDTTVTRYVVTAAPTASMEQSLQHLEWGSSMTANGILALADKVGVIAANETGSTKDLPSEWATWSHDQRAVYLNDTANFVDEAARREWIVKKLPATKVAEKLDTLTDETLIRGFSNMLVDTDGYLTGGVTNGTFNADTKETTIVTGGVGYYVIKDQLAPGAKDEALSRYMLRVAGNIKIQPKSDVPSLTKKVFENSAYSKAPSAVGEDMHAYPAHGSAHVNSSDATDGKALGAWNDVADYNLGDSVPFMLVGTLPSNYGEFAVYNYKMVDTLSKGLTYDAGTAKAYLYDGTTRTELTMTPSHVENADGTTTLTFDLGNLKQNAAVDSTKQIIVEYTAKLNVNANIGQVGNDNKAHLVFSNDPNFVPTTENPNGPTGETPDDEVIVYAYQLEITKIGSQKQGDDYPRLANARFKLYRASDNKYAVVDANGKITDWNAEGTEVVSKGDGKLSFIGLDKGVYFLKETQAPSGYNKLDGDVRFVIETKNLNNTNSYVSDPAANKDPWGSVETKLVIEVTTHSDIAAPAEGDKTTGKVALKIKNNSGSQLPTTGGMGTTLFYVVGAILTLGAAILLVVKRRMGEEE